MKNFDKNNKTPNHVAIIMDGNGRWAQARRRPRLFGHRVGAARIREILESCPKLGVKYLTIFAFSTENWKRTQAEVAGLMSLFEKYIRKEAANLKNNGVRVRFIGDRIRLEDKLVDLMDDLGFIPDGKNVNEITDLNVVWYSDNDGDVYITEIYDNDSGEVYWTDPSEDWTDADDELTNSLLMWGGLENTIGEYYV